MSAPDNDDDARTLHAGQRVPGTMSPPSVGPAMSSQQDDTHRLPLSMRLGEFEITGYVGEGGFSIVYLAWDHSLDRRVALKEYMPSSLASRTGATRVIPRSERYRETFDAGLRSFINEGKLLAQFDHPSLVKVYRFWEAHGTAYMVMPYYEGATLKDTVRSLAQPPDEAWLRKLLEPLTAALLVIHEAQCYHRDIAPDNVMLLAGSGRPLLLDFGAARRVIGDRTQALTVILKPGYAPVEQYAEDPGMTQGAWTDVYALGAVIYWAVTGNTPPTSVSRLLKDTYVPLTQCAAGRYELRFLAAVDRALQVLPDNRTRSISLLRDDLGIRSTGAQTDPATVAWSDPELTVIRPFANPPSASAPPTLPGVDSLAQLKERQRDGAPRLTANPPASSRSLRPLALLGVVSLALVAGAAWWVNRSPAPVVATGSAESAARPAPPTTPVPSPEPAPPTPTASTPTAANALQLLLSARDPRMSVTASLEAGRAGAVRVQFSASEPGYAYVVASRDDRNELVIISPPPGKAGGKLSAEGRLDLTLSRPADALTYYFVWTREPRDLPSAGWSIRDRSWVREYGARNAAAAADPALGPPQCASGAPTCDAAYGVTEVKKVTNVTPPAPSRESEQSGRGGSMPRSESPTKSEPRTARTASTPTEEKAAGNRTPRLTAECEAILNRMSLGIDSAEDRERFKTLRCGS